jgi:hypothetical protein
LNIIPETKVEGELLAFETTILLPPVDLSEEVVAVLRTFVAVLASAITGRLLSL